MYKGDVTGIAYMSNKIDMFGEFGFQRRLWTQEETEIASEGTTNWNWNQILLCLHRLKFYIPFY